jgi:mono/diheme cytochrome c family protein
MRPRPLVLAFAGLVGLSSAPARAQLALPPGDPQAGRAFALEACSVCHIVAPGQRVSPRIASAVTFRQIANTEGMTGMKLQAILSTPHRIMPNLILTPEEAANVIAYILTLRSGAPQRP